MDVGDTHALYTASLNSRKAHNDYLAQHPSGLGAVKASFSIGRLAKGAVMKAVTFALIYSLPLMFNSSDALLLRAPAINAKADSSLVSPRASELSKSEKTELRSKRHIFYQRHAHAAPARQAAPARDSIRENSVPPAVNR